MNEPLDALVRWDRDDIGALDVTAFETGAPILATHQFSISFWFRAVAFSGRQILVSVGNRESTLRGWSVFLHRDHIVLRVNLPASINAAQVHLSPLNAETSVPITDPERWHHFAGIANRETGMLAGYLDGSCGGWVSEPPTLHQAPGALDDDGQLVIGGYTDAAGGHFDYTFGRQGSGLIDDVRIYAHALSATEIAALVDDHNRPAAVRANIAPTLNSAMTPLPITPVFVNGEEGYACYRIPAIVRAANGDLLAFAEGRLAGCSDSTSIIRLVCKRSRDHGVTWDSLQVVARNVVDGAEYACMNPAPVVDCVLKTGRILVVFNQTEFSEWDVVQGQGLIRVSFVYSDDNGYSWSEDVDITRHVHQPYDAAYAAVHPEAVDANNKETGWRKHAVLPGHAIQLRATPAIRGRLFFVGSYTVGAAPVFYANNYAFWSDDLGASWHIGATITIREDGTSAVGLGEAMAVELKDGSVLVNSRNYQHGHVVGRRAATIGLFDADGRVHFQPARHDVALVDSGVQATILRVTRHDESRNEEDEFVLFANPDHPRARVNMAVRLSYDQGQTWPVHKVIDPGPSAYSDLVEQADMKIGLLYEQGNQGGIAYVNFELEWLENRA